MKKIILKKSFLITGVLFALLFFANCSNLARLGALGEVDTYKDISVNEILDPNKLGDRSNDLFGSRGGNSTFFKLAQQALQAWDIKLNTGLSRYGRGGENGVAHWITVSDSDCIAEGVTGFDCPFFNPNIVGVCAYEASSLTGAILNSTVVIRKSYLLNEIRAGTTQAEHLAVFIHEIGHCLGLRHTTSTSQNCTNGGTVATQNCVMYPNIGTANTQPRSEEIAAIKAAYNPVREPTAFEHRNRFFPNSGAGILRQLSTPEFYISPIIGKGARYQQAQHFRRASSDDPDIIRVVHTIKYSDAGSASDRTSCSTHE